jgi:hypothetical protein
LKLFTRAWSTFSLNPEKLTSNPEPGDLDQNPESPGQTLRSGNPELNQGSCLQNFSFPSLPSRSEPRDHEVSLKLHSEATRKDPDPKKIPRALFDVLNLCAKFQDHILTGSTSNRGTTRPPRDQICACLLYTH